MNIYIKLGIFILTCIIIAEIIANMYYKKWLQFCKKRIKIE